MLHENSRKKFIYLSSQGLDIRQVGQDSPSHAGQLYKRITI